MSALLDAVLQDAAAPFVLRYDIGDDFGGETHVRLAGDGAYEIRSTATVDARERSYLGSVEPARVREIATAWRDAGVPRIAHFRSRATDDPPARLSVEHDGASATVSLWVSEVGDSEAFQTAQAPMLALAHEVSGGEIIEAGR